MAITPGEAVHVDIDGGWVLPEPGPREAVCTRSIVCRSFRRADGGVDIDGRFIDTRPFAYNSPWRGDLQAGSVLHQMQLRLTIDRQRSIQAVLSAMPDTPYTSCPEVNPNFQRLVGLCIGRGFRKALREKLDGIEGCTHVIALLDAMAAAAVQSFASLANAPRAPGDPEPVRIFNIEFLANTCYSYRPDGPVLRQMQGKA